MRLLIKNTNIELFLYRKRLWKAHGGHSRRFPGTVQRRRVHLPGRHLWEHTSGAVQTDGPHGGQVVLPPRDVEGHGRGRGPGHTHLSGQGTCLIHLL